MNDGGARGDVITRAERKKNRRGRSAWPVERDRENRHVKGQCGGEGRWKGLGLFLGVDCCPLVRALGFCLGIFFFTFLVLNLLCPFGSNTQSN